MCAWVATTSCFAFTFLHYSKVIGCSHHYSYSLCLLSLSSPTLSGLGSNVWVFFYDTTLGKVVCVFSGVLLFFIAAQVFCGLALLSRCMMRMVGEAGSKQRPPLTPEEKNLVDEFE